MADILDLIDDKHVEALKRLATTEEKTRVLSGTGLASHSFYEAAELPMLPVTDKDLKELMNEINLWATCTLIHLHEQKHTKWHENITALVKKRCERNISH